ncbi:MAG: hypothetical protein AABN95_07480 [Acidobacteriota bacterium]
MGFARCIGIISLFFILSQPTCGQGQLLLIDRSGSMKAYYENGLINELGQRINNLMQAQNLTPVKLGAFNSQVQIVPNIANIQVNGPTYLDAAIDYAIDNHYSLVWMVTDNIMHRHGEEEGQTHAFYDRLKDNAVSRVVIFPLKQDPGTRKAGIIVYALLLSANAEGIFRKEINDFAHLTPNTVLLPMKPLDRETIETTFVDREHSYKKSKPIYEDGSLVKEAMELRFKSKFEHLRITDADIVNPRVAPEFSKNSLLVFERDNVKITPTKITELGPHNETVQVYRVEVDLGKITLKRDFVSLWRAALKDPNEEISLDLSFSINVPKENFQFTETFLRDYSSETTEMAKAQGKIYDLNGLPLLVAENSTSIKVPHKPKIHVRYPSWLVFIFPGIPIGLIALVIAGGIVAWRAIKRAGKGKPQWSVDVKSPPQGKGLVKGGWVVVNVDGKQNRLGQINGNTLVSAAGVKPKESQTIKEGESIILTLRRQDYALIFRRMSPPEELTRQGKKEKKIHGNRSTTKI